jgi:hypothetical protein
MSKPTARRRLALAVLGAATFAAPLTASAQTSVAPATPPMSPPPAHSMSMTRHAADKMRRETLDQRISTLHAALKITPAQEADWAKVADVMRRNESDMQKLVAERQAQVPHELSAVDDLKTYQTFTQAHVDGLKDLVAAFSTLYDSMPSEQKIIADHAFAKFGRERVAFRHGMQARS